jgi:hypothetical protein
VATPSTVRNIVTGVVVLIIVGYVVTAVILANDDSEIGDASAQLACRDFYDVAGEADLITDAELRDRLQDIWNTAEVSETPGIAEAARAMLAAATSGDVDALEVAVDDMSAACSDVEPL